MRIIIISDVKNNTGDIVTYGLNLAKFYEVEVDILHMIDPRTQHGVSSQVADSQSIAPGGKMSPAEIIEREKRQAEIELDKVLSKEASRLNYPLKINTYIEEYSLEKKLVEMLNQNPSSVVLMNSQTDKNALGNRNDILNTIETINGIYLLVPPDKEYEPIKEILVSTQFGSDDLDRLNKMAHLLQPLNPKIDSVGVGLNGDVEKVPSENWKQSIESIVSTSKINILELEGENYDDTLINHIRKTKPDLAVMFKREKNLLNRLFRKSITEKILENADVPLLYYSF